MDYEVTAVSSLQTNNDLRTEKYRIRLYGNILGTTKEIIDFWSAIENNYISIIAHEKIIAEFIKDDKKINSKSYPNSIVRFNRFGTNQRSIFMEHYEKYSVSDIISPDEYPIITKISFNSPGFWEVIGQWNPFEQLRKYIQERHLRNRDRKYVWDLEKKNNLLEIESKQLSNDLLKLDITQKMISQLKKIGLSDIEIRHIVQKSYSNLELLNSHIDEGRITDIRIENNDEI